MSAMSRRIAYLSSRYPVLREAFIIREVLALQREGVEVTAFTLKRPQTDLVSRDLDEIDADVYWTPHLLHGRLLLDNLATLTRSPLSYVATPFRNAWRVRRYPLQVIKYLGLFPKMIHYGREMQRRGIHGVNACWANLPTVAASVASRFFGIRYCMTCRAWDIFVPMNQVDLTPKIRSAAVLRTNNLNGAAHMKTFCTSAEDEEKIHTVYNPFDVPGMTPREGIPGGPVRITAGGSLIEQKGLTYLLDALALLRDRGLEVSLELIGVGAEEQNLRDQTARLKLKDRVTFLGTMPNPDVLAKMKSSHAFVLPCVPARGGWMDGIPNVLIESMALGVPVVSTSISGIPELVEDGACGFLVPPRDATALADVLSKLLSDRELQETFGREGRAKVESLFEMSANARKLIGVYDAAGMF